MAQNIQGLGVGINPNQSETKQKLQQEDKKMH